VPKNAAPKLGFIAFFFSRNTPSCIGNGVMVPFFCGSLAGVSMLSLVSLCVKFAGKEKSTAVA